MNAAAEKKRRVLLMYISKVSGHRQATVAIEQALKQIEPTIETPSVNGFGYTYPMLEKIINRAYMSVIKATPKVWDYMYDNPQIFKNSQSIKKYLHKTSHDKIGMLLGKYKPEAVVCTQAFPCGMVADYKRVHNNKTLLIGVLTDYAPHSYWINEGVDYYVVPSQEAKERFIQKGVPAQSIMVYGIPLRSQFVLHPDKEKIASQLGLDLAKPIILIMGGGQGLGPIKKIVKSLVKIERDVQIIALVGVNKKVAGKVRKLTKKTNKKILVFDFVTNVDELMEVATLIITKPGGLTTAECLAKGLPMVIVDPLPGQEMRNTDFLIKKGIAIRIHEINDIGDEIELLLKSPDRLNKMHQAAFANANPDSSLKIAKLILNQDRENSQATPLITPQPVHV